jgi:glycosyltransferase involved in cell wall biosynthesis
MTHFINITIPVFNEETSLATNVHRLLEFLQGKYANRFELVIIDNASTDGTLAIARDLQRYNSRVQVLHLDLKGRGRALKKAWLESRADILSYMDVDLSTDLGCFPPLIEPLESGRADLCAGSRLSKASETRRGLRREIISRCYNLIIRALFQVRFSDAQCGFKALTRRAADSLLPFVEDDSWFFDTELLLLAERRRYVICDLPVKWQDDPDSRVKIIKTAIDDISGLLRLRHAFKKEDNSKI